MKRIPVLGASEKNLKAINLALSSPSRPGKDYGSVKPNLNFKKDEADKEFEHPFKMRIVKENEDHYLKINKARVTVNDAQHERCVFLYEDDPISLSALSTSGEYIVGMTIQYDPDYTWTDNGDSQDSNSYFKSVVYFSNNDGTVQTGNLPSTRGIFYSIIGFLNVDQDLSGNLTYSIKNQRLTSDLFVDFHSLNHPFSITAKGNEWHDGDLKNIYSLSEFTFNVQKGRIIINDSYINVAKTAFQTSEDTYVYCTCKEEPAPTAYITYSSSQKPYLDENTNEYNYFIGMIYLNDNGIGIDQYVHDFIGGGNGGDTFKVKTTEFDGHPDYLSAKIKFQEEILSADQSYLSSFIGEKLIYEQLDISGTLYNSYKLEPIWMWKKIENFDPEKDQVIRSISGELQWGEATLELSGSINNVFDLISGQYLRVKTEYNNSVNQFNFLNLNSNGQLQYTTFNGDPNTNGEQGIMVWNYTSRSPGVELTPNDNPDEDQVLAGSKTNGLYWVPLKQTISGMIEELSGELSGELYKVSVDGSDEGDYLQNKIGLDSSLSGFFELNNSNGTLKIKLKNSVNGIIFANQGELRYLQVPSTGKSVLASIDGELTWVEVIECEDACDEEE